MKNRPSPSSGGRGAPESDAASPGAADALFAALLEATPEMLGYVDRGFVVRFVNRAYAEFFRLDPATAIGRPLAEVVGRRAWAAIAPHAERAASGVAASYVRELTAPDGARRAVRVDLVPRVEQGEVIGVLGSCRNITAQAEAERALAARESELRTVLAGLPGIVAYADREGRYRYANERYCEFFLGHRDTSAVVGKSIGEVIGAHGQEEVAVSLATALSGEAVRYERLVPSTDSGVRCIEVSLVPLRAGGRVIGCYANIVDTTAARAQAEAVRLRTRALDATQDAVMITDAVNGDYPIVWVNAAFERLTGYAAREVIGRNPRFLRVEGERGVSAELESAISRREEGGALLRNVRKDGTEFWNELHVAPVPDESGRVTHFVGVATDVSERVAYQGELEHRATHDSLTGIANRALLIDRIEHAVAEAGRRGRGVGVALLDLDRFKLVNDERGHAAGDELLRGAARRLEGAVRPGDTLARLGGDEFVAVLSDLGAPEDAAGVIERMLRALEQPIEIPGGAVEVSGSVGLSLFPHDGAVPEALLRNADAAMYEAKQRRVRMVRFDARTHQRFRPGALARERALRGALTRDELFVQFQPIVHPFDAGVRAGEVLLRWRCEGVTVAPLDFIPLAEDTGLIVPIGRWVIERAVACLDRWSEPRLALSVNLSARQFADEQLTNLVRDTLERYRVDPGRLTFEVTESVLMRDAEASRRTLVELDALGVCLAVDDFGTGYSSLAYLKRFPLDVLKLDRAFVGGIETDRENAAIARAVVDLAHSLGLKVVAEGVETEAERRFLLHIGCDAMQGYLFGRPMHEEDFARTLGASG